ncbi:hypothetical protein CIRG_05294 [Coccidioides immitis RMSCC 2394]|uniref:Uncharacterized protein n=1 Tax=Coccidioides immitis RMSCC 2394 TaxID=404692 RepID=A0A0J6YF89_COCIT|nr:hypothetical protein CIRG_05294 [Coccidioides immitis RMSCC 2394]
MIKDSHGGVTEILSRIMNLNRKVIGAGVRQELHLRQEMTEQEGSASRNGAIVAMELKRRGSRGRKGQRSLLHVGQYLGHKMYQQANQFNQNANCGMITQHLKIDQGQANHARLSGNTAPKYGRAPDETLDNDMHKPGGLHCPGHRKKIRGHIRITVNVPAITKTQDTNERESVASEYLSRSRRMRIPSSDKTAGILSTVSCEFYCYLSRGYLLNNRNKCLCGIEALVFDSSP